MLGLTHYVELPRLEPASPVQRRSPFVALLLSVLIPGLGHLYLGMRRNALWIAGFEFFSLAAIFSGSGTLHAQALLVAPILYCFAGIDSYFAAREYNAGVGNLLIGCNPRIVAVLNLLTKGFGYFYLGDRAKGIICFLICSSIQAALLLHFNIWTSSLASSLQVAIAVDGYRIARHRLFTTHVELAPTLNPEDDLIACSNPGGLPPTIATAFFIGLSAFFLIGYSTLRAITGHFITTQGFLENGPSGLIYNHKAEHISITVPEDWTSARTSRSLVMLKGDNASVILLDEYSIFAAASNLDADRKELIGRQPTAIISYPHLVISNHQANAFDAQFTNSSKVDVHQRIAYFRRGFKLIVLIETWVNDGQRLTLDQIEKTFTF